MTTTELRQALPTGTWHLDPVHSSIGFELAYMGGVFRGQFREVEATITDGGVTGSAQVASVDVKDENLAAHLASPEFFDVERYPELRFASTEIEGGEELTISGDITTKGVTRLLDGLEAAGYVERAACSSDRRVTYAVLTESGLAKLREAADSHVAAVQTLFEERFSEDELGQLGALLARLPGAEGTAAESCSPE